MAIHNPIGLNVLAFWRQQYNPLRGLTMTRVAAMLEQAEYGYLADITWLYRFVEKRDATVRALVARRVGAISKLNWDVKPKQGMEEDAAALKQAEALKEQLNGIDNLNESIRALAQAEFRGFSILEKHYTNDGDVFHLEPVPQWFWCKPAPYTRFQYNQSAQQTNRGLPIEESNFIIRECEACVDEIAVMAFIRKNLSQKDWDGFVETYGLPPLFIQLPENAPVSQLEEYQAIAEKVIGDGRGVLPFGAKAVPLNTATERDGGGERNVFNGHIKYQDEQIVLAGTGGKLTMLNDPTGLGSGQSEVHADTFNDLAVAEAQTISKIMQEQLCVPLLQKDSTNDVLCEFSIVAPDDTDIQLLTQTIKDLHSAGMDADPEEVGQKVKLTLTKGQAPVPFGAKQLEENIPNRMPRGKVAQKTRKAVARALDAEFVSLRKRIGEIAQVENDEIRNDKMRRLREELPQILKDLNMSPAAADPIAAGLAAEFFNGLAK